MFKKLEKIIYNKYFKIFLFLLLIIISISFLIFQRGVFLNSDAGYWPTGQTNLKILLYESFNSFRTTPYYFGYPSEFFASQRSLLDPFIFLLSTIFGSDLGQLIYYLIYFLLVFFPCKYFFDYIKKSDNNFYIALFFTFNPIPLWMMSQTAQMYTYSSIFLIAWGVTLFFSKKWVQSFFIIPLGINFLFLYSRTYVLNILILLGFLIYLLFSFFMKEKINFIKENSIKFILLILFIILINLPQFISVINTLKGEGPVLNHLSRNWEMNQNWDQWLFETPVKFYSLMGIKSLFNFLSSNLIIFFYTFLLIIILSLLLLFREYKNSKLKNYLIFLFLLVSLSQILPTITNNEGVLLMIYNIFFFLNRQISWGVYLFPFLYVFFIFILYGAFPKKMRLLITIFLIICLLTSSAGFINFDNFQIKKAGLNEIDSIRISDNGIYSLNSREESTMFLPFANLEKAYFFSNLPYPILYNNLFPNKPEFFSDNVRISQLEEINIRENWRLFGDKLKIFNLKNFYVAKPMNAIENFDWYENKIDKEGQSKSDFLYYSTNESYVVESENKFFTFFSFKDKNSYDFLIYSSNKITDEKAFLDGSFNLNSKPIIWEKQDISKLDHLNLQSDGFLEVKKSQLKPSIMYIHFKDFDSSKLFVLQLDRAYSKEWKIFAIDKNYYDSIECKDLFVSYLITNNSYCNYNPSLFDLKFSLLFREELNNTHLKGNIIGNSWIIYPREKKSDFYAIILYKPQITFSFIYFVQYLALLLVVLILIIQFFSNKKLINKFKQKVNK